MNDRGLAAEGRPLFMRELTASGFRPVELDMSEFRKRDGGLGCLSLRL